MLFLEFVIRCLLLKKEIKLRDNISFNINSKEKKKFIFILNICFCLQSFDRLLLKLNTNML